MKKVDFLVPKLHILICVNDRENSDKVSCFKNHPNLKEDIKNLKEWLISKNLIKKVKITRTSCLGICPSEGIIIMIYPPQEYYQINSIDEIKEIILNFRQEN